MSLIPRSGRGRGGGWSLSGACTQPHPAPTLCPIVCPGTLGPGGGEYVSDFPLGGLGTFLSIMSQNSFLKRVLFGWYSIDTFHSGSRRFLSRSVFHQSKISYIYKKDFFYHLQVLTFVHLMPLIVFDLDRGCCPYSSPNDTPCVPSSSWLIPPWGDVRSLYPPYGLERVFTII